MRCSASAMPRPISVFRERGGAGAGFHAGGAGRRELAALARSASALVETSLMPLPDACVDRVLVVHALETVERPREHTRRRSGAS